MSKGKFERVKPHLNAVDEVENIVPRATTLRSILSVESISHPTATLSSPTSTPVSSHSTRNNAIALGIGIGLGIGAILIAVLVVLITFWRRRSAQAHKTAKTDIFETKIREDKAADSSRESISELSEVDAKTRV